MRIRIFVCVCAAALLLAACQRSDGNASAGKMSVAVIPKGTTHEFWKSIHAGAIMASRELGVEIFWKGPLREDDREEQIKIVEDFITRGISGIVLAPLDDMALRKPVADAVRNNVPVVIIDSGLSSDQYLSFIATDNRLGGKIAGDHLAKLLGRKGRVAVLRYHEGSASTREREEGFLEAIKAYPGIEVVSSNQYGGPTTETAYQASENILGPLRVAEGFALDGIFCPTESTTFGMLRALDESGYGGRVRFIGFDNTPKLTQALRSGKLDALVVQDPVQMGYLGVKTVARYLKGDGSAPKFVDTGVNLVTLENIDQPAIKKLLEPDLSALSQ